MPQPHAGGFFLTKKWFFFIQTKLPPNRCLQIGRLPEDEAVNTPRYPANPSQAIFQGLLTRPGRPSTKFCRNQLILRELPSVNDAALPRPIVFCRI
jgi:hypothetical protein